MRFITELFGPMLSKTEATETPRATRRSSFSGQWMPYLYWHSKGVPYGGNGQYGACWAAPDHAWRLTYQSGGLDYECYRRPTDEDLRKLCFLIGWFKIRSDNYFVEHSPELWRRGNEHASEPKEKPDVITPTRRRRG